MGRTERIFICARLRSADYGELCSRVCSEPMFNKVIDVVISERIAKRQQMRFLPEKAFEFVKEVYKRAFRREFVATTKYDSK